MTRPPLSAYGAVAFILALLGAVVVVGLWPTPAAFAALGGVLVLLALGALSCVLDWHDARRTHRYARAFDEVDADVLGQVDDTR